MFRTLCLTVSSRNLRSLQSSAVSISSNQQVGWYLKWDSRELFLWSRKESLIVVKHMLLYCPCHWTIRCCVMISLYSVGSLKIGFALGHVSAVHLRMSDAHQYLCLGPKSVLYAVSIGWVVEPSSDAKRPDTVAKASLNCFESQT